MQRSYEDAKSSKCCEVVTVALSRCARRRKSMLLNLGMPQKTRSRGVNVFSPPPGRTPPSVRGGRAAPGTASALYQPSNAPAIHSNAIPLAIVSGEAEAIVHGVSRRETASIGHDVMGRGRRTAAELQDQRGDAFVMRTHAA
eukprot:5144945-Prymnesium_polylepis.1